MMTPGSSFDTPSYTASPSEGGEAAAPYAPPPEPELVQVEPQATAEMAPPGVVLAPMQVALMHLGEGRLDEARAELQSLLATQDGDHRAMFFLAWSLRLLGDKFLAQQFFTIGAKMAEEASDESFVIMYRAELS